MTTYTLSIYIAAAGTQLQNGTNSNAGHMWYRLSGQADSYGFAPAEPAKDTAFPVLGDRVTSDTANYLHPAYSKTYQLTEQEYNLLKEFGKDPFAHGFDNMYWAPSNSCVDFVWKAFEYAGLNPSQHQGSLMPWDNRDDLHKFMSLPMGEQQQLLKMVNDLLPISGQFDLQFSEILITQLQTSFTTAKTIDPIILDLNGDGVQTRKLSKSLSAGVHFNLDTKGLAENTGWVDAQDGLLVRDIDGDGRITSGRELFGNHALLTKGVNAGKEAANGFEALKELDDNNDGVVDAKDAAFNTLKVWRDADGDAVTDVDELLTLAQAGVKSLKVAYTSGTSTDAQGNAHQQLGSFTTTDGVTRNMDDVWFAVDTARTVETNLVSVSADIQALPDLVNMGNVRSLHQAMARDATGQIQTLLQQWQSSHGATREAVLDKLIYQWAGVQGIDPASRGVYMDGRQLGALERFLGTDFVRGNPSNSTIAQPLLQAYNLLHLQLGSELFWQTDASKLLSKLKLSWADADLNAASGTQAATGHFEWSARPLADTLHARFTTGSLQDGIQDFQLFVTAVKHHGGDSVLQTLQTQANQYTDAYGVFLEKINLLTTSTMQIGTGSSERLSVNNASVLMGLAGNDTMTGSSAADVLIGGVGNDSLDGGYGSDIYIFSKGDGVDTVVDCDYTAGNIDTLKLGDGLLASETQVSSSGLDLKLSWGMDSVVLQNYLYSDAYRIEKISFADGTVWGLTDIAERLTRNGGTGADSITGFTNYANRINGLSGDDYLYGGYKDDVLDGGDGNDYLIGYYGNNLLRGGAGNDKLNGGNDVDVLIGDDGADSLWGGYGDDTLTGGTGNDSLDGSYGNDTYIFSKGDGVDTVVDCDYTAGNIDTLKLGDGLLASETQVSSSGLDLKLSWGMDSVVLQNYLYSDAYRIEKISFADGTVWGLTDIAERLTRNGGTGADSITGFTNYANRINGLSGDDYLYGGYKDDVLDGGDGNDYLIGYSGNNLLRGGAGNDKLNGGEDADVLSGDDGADSLWGGYGNDTLTGGVGNDSLDGGYGSDIYIFSKGDGVDTVVDCDYTAGNIDTLKLGDGLLASETQVSSSGLDLKLSWGEDSVVLQNYLYSDAYRVEKISFADGTVWSLADIAERLTRSGGTGADSITGFTNYANRINGLGGNDYLYGGNKSDTLAGGLGSDTLVGGGGADSFVFNEILDAGNADVITDFSVAQGDKLVLDKRVFTQLANLSSLNGNFRFSTQVSVGGDDYIVYNNSTGQLFYDATGSGSNSAMVFATLQNKPTDLSSQQFVVI